MTFFAIMRFEYCSNLDILQIILEFPLVFKQIEYAYHESIT